jgi:amidase
VLLGTVTPFPPTKHGLNDLVVDGKMVSTFHVMSATSPFSLTRMPALSMRFGTSRDGLPIGVQIVSSWLAESSVIDVALRLEKLSRVGDRHRNLYPRWAAQIASSVRWRSGPGTLRNLEADMICLEGTNAAQHYTGDFICP